MISAGKSRYCAPDPTPNLNRNYRIAGGLNRPADKKIMKGRSPIPYQTTMVSVEGADDAGVSLKTMRAAILERFGPVVFVSPKEPRTPDEDKRPFPNKPRVDLSKRDADHLIRCRTGEDRSRQAFIMLRALKQRNFTVREAVTFATEYMEAPTPYGTDNALDHYASSAEMESDFARSWMKIDVEPLITADDLLRKYMRVGKE